MNNTDSTNMNPTDPNVVAAANALRARLAEQGVRTDLGIEVAEYLAEEAGLSEETLQELAALDMEDRGEWPEDQGISGSDIAGWLEFLGTDDIAWLDERIKHVAKNGL